MGIKHVETYYGQKPDIQKFYGKKISSANFSDDCISLSFEDGISIKIEDYGQSCCETRYMVCDDNIQSLVGGILKEILVKETEIEDENTDVHEIAFLEIITDNACVNISSHNEHNGFYGGFSLEFNEIK